MIGRLRIGEAKKIRLSIEMLRGSRMCGDGGGVQGGCRIDLDHWSLPSLYERDYASVFLHKLALNWVHVWTVHYSHYARMCKSPFLFEGLRLESRSNSSDTYASSAQVNKP